MSNVCSEIAQNQSISMVVERFASAGESISAQGRREASWDCHQSGCDRAGREVLNELRVLFDGPSKQVVVDP